MRINEITTDLDGHHLLLRNPCEKDAAMLIEYLRTTCSESDFLLKDPEEITFTSEDECRFINEQNSAAHTLMLLGFMDGEYVGNCSYTGMSLNKLKHRASLGIALYHKYTGMGIGRIMIQKLCDIAKENNIEQMELEVVTHNKSAVSLYRKMGFEIFGTLPNNMKNKNGSYADVYWMMKRL